MRLPRLFPQFRELTVRSGGQEATNKQRDPRLLLLWIDLML